MATLLIFGASRGLGRALAEEHLKRGWDVIATVRKSDALKGLQREWGKALEVETLDITDWAEVDSLRKRLEGRVIDLLFVNVGISGRMAPIGEVDPERFAELMLVNTLAPLRIIDRFAALVPASGTIAVMTSELGSISQNTSGGFDDYRISKVALNMGLRSIAGRRAVEGRTYLAVSPGWVKTDMGGPNAMLTIEESIPRVADAIERRRGSGGMSFINYQDLDVPW